jgi:hypothetical protein
MHTVTTQDGRQGHLVWPVEDFPRSFFSRRFLKTTFFRSSMISEYFLALICKQSWLDCIYLNSHTVNIQNEE